jgi:hypothetical protein
VARRFHSPATVTHADPEIERMRLNFERRIGEIQKAPVMAGLIFRDVSLASGVNTPIPHNFNRRALHFHSAPRASASATTGRIREIVDPELFDPKKYLVLKANGWSETIVVDVWVF